MSFGHVDTREAGTRASYSLQALNTSVDLAYGRHSTNTGRMGEKCLTDTTPSNLSDHLTREVPLTHTSCQRENGGWKGWEPVT